MEKDIKNNLEGIGGSINWFLSNINLIIIDVTDLTSLNQHIIFCLWSYKPWEMVEYF